MEISLTLTGGRGCRGQVMKIAHISRGGRNIDNYRLNKSLNENYFVKFL